MSVTHLTVDAAGTLLRPHPSVGKIYAEVLELHGGHAEPSYLEARFANAFSKLSIKKSMDKIFWMELVRRTIGDACPVNHFESFFEDLWNTFAEGRRWSIVSGVEETLDEFRKKGIGISVLSNNDGRLHKVLCDLGIRKWFHKVFISEEIGTLKPSAEIFRHVERNLNYKPVELMHIGDSLEADYLGAIRVGWKSNFLRRDKPRRVPRKDWWPDWKYALKCLNS